ncbi:DMT family transporter [uncultured Litoreibacter sp.]|uniref:DMT family transporter n=1 Tax=uncultured Litoreibacter sp. TaxID=1392394 RepID=UPI00262DE8FA|nr:DMT family transporter [uncultured Litoreibacter sp.]
MGSLTLGLIAALCWGFHDICVRYVSQRTGILPAFLTVLVVGCLLVVPLAVFAEGLWPKGNGVWWSLASGLMFGLAGSAHYKAFSIGPVRLVAPIIGAYPALSVGWAVLNGEPITLFQWLAVFMIIGGVGFVAASSDDEASAAPKLEAVIWSILAGTGFAITFALGHIATTWGAELATIAIARIAAMLVLIALALGLPGPVLPQRAQLPILAVMGVLDTVALGAVLIAGTRDNPEFAAVAASTFGLLTVLLAWLFLKEKMTLTQWGGVMIVFAAIGYLAL